MAYRQRPAGTVAPAIQMSSYSDGQFEQLCAPDDMNTTMRAARGRDPTATSTVCSRQPSTAHSCRIAAIDPKFGAHLCELPLFPLSIEAFLHFRLLIVQNNLYRNGTAFRSQ